MKNILFLLGFFTGWIPIVLSVPRKYHLIQQGKTWNDSLAYCRTKHTDLAIIRSDDDLVQLQKEVQRQQFTSKAWIGLYDDLNSWRWSIGDKPPGSKTYWAPGEPNNWNGDEECTAVQANGWVDKPCTDMYPFVCFDNINTGIGSFIYISSKMNWAAAQSYCRHLHTDLASVNSYTENTEILGLVPINDKIWIGLFRDSWKWTDKSNLSTIPMSVISTGAPCYETCGYINNIQAARAYCSDVMPFLCYSDVSVKKQIVRVKVQSNQDVNDPVIKATILEKIKQKIKDRFVTVNTTVIWRENPDGVVFHKDKN